MAAGHYTEREVTFTSEGYEIVGTLHLPKADRPPVVIGSHGLFSDGDSAKQIALARQLADRGIAFLSFHHRGCGKSGGDFSQVTTLEGRRRDLLDAVAFIRSRTDVSGRIGLFGSSFGGAVCLAAAADIDPAAMALVAAPIRVRTADEAMAAIRQSGESLSLSPDFYERNLTFDVSGALPDIHHALIIHGEDDTVIPAHHATEIHRNSREPKRLVIQPRGDHRITDPIHQKEFIREATEWLTEHLR